MKTEEKKKKKAKSKAKKLDKKSRSKSKKSKSKSKSKAPVDAVDAVDVVDAAGVRGGEDECPWCRGTGIYSGPMAARSYAGPCFCATGSEFGAGIGVTEIGYVVTYSDGADAQVIPDYKDGEFQDYYEQEELPVLLAILDSMMDSLNDEDRDEDDDDTYTGFDC